eukprot:SAG31_NODE_33124_length_347_cov_1.189516_1_plen_66_part_01
MELVDSSGLSGRITAFVVLLFGARARRCRRRTFAGFVRVGGLVLAVLADNGVPLNSPPVEAGDEAD